MVFGCTIFLNLLYVCFNGIYLKSSYDGGGGYKNIQYLMPLGKNICFLKRFLFFSILRLFDLVLTLNIHGKNT